MKSIFRNYKHYILMLLLAVCAASCTPESADFNQSDLIGKWVLMSNGQASKEYWRYNANATGSTWDEADDVSEDEAQAFEWTLEGDQLTQIHKFESSNAVVPKVYTVTQLTATQLTYKDNYRQTFEFSKVN